MKTTQYMFGRLQVCLGIGLMGIASVGCGSSPPAKDPTTGSTIKDSTGQAVSQVAVDKFKAAMKIMAQHDRANDWVDASCAASAEAFKEAAAEQGGKVFYEALYNAGVSYQRCKNDAEAKAVFTDILKKNTKFHRARVQVALYAFHESGEKDIEAAIAEMKRAISDAEYKNVEALVNLAMFQMRRDSDQADGRCKNDFECAKLNLQRALAVNDSFMPAFNQLAIYYLERAKKKAGSRGRGRIAASSSKKKRVDTQALELAALVCSQAIRKNPRYAPIHNTSGLISYELDDLSAAARAFGRARKLDPRFFEAHMNYAAVNQKFRGFKQAEDGYRHALKLRPKDYEAHLGLALAIRGTINDSNFDKALAEATKELEAAKSIDPSRAETYYNLAILTQEFKARSGNSGVPEGSCEPAPALLEAMKLFKEFIAKAGSTKVYKDGAKRASERLEEIGQIVEFNRQTCDQQKELDAVQKKAEEAAKSKPPPAPAEAPADGDGTSEAPAGGE